MLFGEPHRLLRLDVAGDDEDGVLRRIEAAVIGERVLAPQALDLVAPADHRHAVGVMGEDGGLHRLVQLRARVGVAMHAPLLQNHVALGGDDLVGEHEAGHAVGLVGHHQAEMLLGDALKIGGVVVAGEGVLLAADLRHDFRERALGMLGGALEHEMFEEMRDAGLARGIVGRSVAVPHHMRDDGRAMVGNDDHRHAVAELALDDFRAFVEGVERAAGVALSVMRPSWVSGGAAKPRPRHI